MVKVKKRNGTITDFDENKIIKAVTRAITASKPKDYNKGVLESEIKGVAPLIAANITTYVKNLENVSIEEIHNNVEEELMKLAYYDAAKVYILYREKKREKRAKEREEKRKLLNIEGELDHVSEKFSLNALRVLESRYLIKDEHLKPIENPTELFERIATHVGCANILYDESIFDITANYPPDTWTVNGLLTGYNDYSIKDPEEYEQLNLSIGKYKLNGYNLKQLESLYSKLNQESKMKIKFDEVLNMIKDGKFDKYEKVIKSYFDLMVSQRFMPNTPTIANSGRRLGQLSACFTLPIYDNIISIMDSAKHMAQIFQSGGGVGINYSNLREKGAIISSTSGTSSGPVSFMGIINTITDVVKSGGVRRGANMSILNINSPDIREFIHAKETPHVLENFNVSVGIDKKFWECYRENKPYELISPHTNEVKGYINPRDILNEIAQSAWNSAEPGCIFIDNANKYHVMKDLKGEIQVTNPCGEQFIFPYESCNLGSINLAKFVKDDIVDWEALGKVVYLCVEFLDSIIDINKYPIDQINDESWKTRRIGLGVMGVADLLYILNIPYNSKESYELQEQIAQFISYKAVEKSIEISKKRGSFPYYEQTECKNGRLDISGIYEGSLTNILTLDWEKLLQDVKDVGIRNVYCLTVAPTGSISMIADCSSGIEPQFALVFEKKVAVGNFIYVNPYLEKYLKDNDIEFDDENKNIIAKTGSCGSTSLPNKVKNIFVTSMDIHYIDHVLVQAVWQRWIDNSISKTVNMANNVTSTDILNLYLFAHEIGCKGTTIYRDGSRHTQVLYTENMENKELKASEYALNIYNEKMNYIKLEQQLEDNNQILKDTTAMEELIKSHNKDICPNCNGYTAKIEGCATCIKCGVSFC